MTESLVAQCPHCHTRFRVTQEHLAAADGDVRCGVCLEVFNASNQAAPLTAPEPAPPVAAPAPTPSEAAWPHDELDLSHLELDAEVARLGALEEQRRAPVAPMAPAALAAPLAVTTPQEEPAPALGLAARRPQDDEETYELPSLGAVSAEREPEPESLRLRAAPEAEPESEPLSLTAAEPEPRLEPEPEPEPAFAPVPEPAITPLPAVAPVAPLAAVRAPLKPAPAT
ncbi:zinc-ribbon domain-containing protein, partial [Pseudomonas oryzihabitans]